LLLLHVNGVLQSVTDSSKNKIDNRCRYYPPL